MGQGDAVRADTAGVETIGFGTHRYKAAFAKVAPAAAAGFADGGAACMLGVSRRTQAEDKDRHLEGETTSQPTLCHLSLSE